jgi:hypothetical protein
MQKFKTIEEVWASDLSSYHKGLAIDELVRQMNAQELAAIHQPKVGMTWQEANHLRYRIKSLKSKQAKFVEYETNVEKVRKEFAELKTRVAQIASTLNPDKPEDVQTYAKENLRFDQASLLLSEAPVELSKAQKEIKVELDQFTELLKQFVRDPHRMSYEFANPNCEFRIRIASGCALVEKLTQGIVGVTESMV